MSKLLGRVASALSFAHLAGVASKVRADAGDDDDKRDPAERDHEDGNAKRSKRARKADNDNDDVDANDDDDIDDDDQSSSDDGDGDADGDGKKGKRAKKAKAKAADDDDELDAEDEEDDKQMRGNSAVAKARKMERARCAAIFNAPAAANNVALAAKLAFTTNLSANAAIALLGDAHAQTSTDRYAARASRNPRLTPSGMPQQTTRQAVASSWDNAFASAAGRS